MKRCTNICLGYCDICQYFRACFVGHRLVLLKVPFRELCPAKKNYVSIVVWNLWSSNLNFFLDILLYYSLTLQSDLHLLFVCICRLILTLVRCLTCRPRHVGQNETKSAFMQEELSVFISSPAVKLMIRQEINRRSRRHSRNEMLARTASKAITVRAKSIQASQSRARSTPTDLTLSVSPGNC